MALGLAHAKFWLDQAPSHLTPYSSDSLRAIADHGAEALRRQAESLTPQLGVVLARLLDRPTAPLSVIGCADEDRLALLWGLHAVADGYLRRRGFHRHWSFSTYETGHGANIPHFPEIVFLAEAPIEPTERGLVRLDLPPVHSRHREPADWLVSEFFQPREPREVETDPARPDLPLSLAFSGGADATVRVWDVEYARELDTISLDDSIHAIEATRDGYLVVIDGTSAFVFRHVDHVSGEKNA